MRTFRRVLGLRLGADQREAAPALGFVADRIGSVDSACLLNANFDSRMEFAKSEIDASSFGTIYNPGSPAGRLKSFPVEGVFGRCRNSIPWTTYRFPLDL